MVHKVYLALGSNLGDRAQNLSRAVELISLISGVEILKLSNIYETEPVGYVNQDRFLNRVICLRTSIEPLALLNMLQGVEKELLRTREIHWGPRTIDIDILLYDDLVLELPQLMIPHPRMFERAFVLVPLREIYPDGVLGEKNLDECIRKSSDVEGIRRYAGVMD